MKKNIKLSILTALVVWNGGLFGASLRADSSVDELRALKQQVEALEQKIKVLERNSELRSEAAEQKHKETPLITAGAEGFSMRSADTNFVLKIRAYGQFDGRFYADNGPGKDTFVMRRMRLMNEGTVFQHYDYRVLLDFGSGITSNSTNNAFLQDALVNFHYWPQFQIQVGKFKEPVSLETLQSDANLIFLERGLPTQLAPNRDVGIQFHGELLKGKLTYAVGAFNGLADGGSGDIESGDEDKDIAARIFSEPFKDSDNQWLKGLGLGVGSSFGNQEGTLASYQTPGRQKFFTFPSGAGTNVTTANVIADGFLCRIAPQGYYYVGPFGLFGEYVISSQELRRNAGGTPTFSSVNKTAWNVVLHYLLTGEQNSFKPVKPSHPFSIADGGWGAWELAARIGQLEIEKAAFPLFASASSVQRADSWGVGLNWYLNRNVKLNLDYEQTHFKAGSKAPGSVTAQDEKVFMTRAQFSF